MNIQKYKIVDIAEIQLNCACKIYLSGNDFFSPLTLAGAAEEIFGKLSKRINKTNAVEAFAKSLLAIINTSHGSSDPVQSDLKDNDLKRISAIIDRINAPRNAYKHYNQQIDESMAIIEIDPIVEAWDMIYRAIENYYLCRQTYTDPMIEFLRHDKKQFDKSKP